MSSRAGVFGKWLRLAVAGILLLLVSFYLLLVSGFLADLPGMIASRLASVDGTTIDFSNLRTDIFWHTSADSVVVRQPDGLVVSVAGADIQGSLVDFLLSRHVDTVKVDFLGIQLSDVPRDPNAPPDSLARILRDIDDGIVTSADRLRLDYGIITREGVTLVDSMLLDTRVERGSAVNLDIDTAGVFLPELGSVRGEGVLQLRQNTVWADEFQASLPPGSLTVSGSLTGREGGLDLRLSGGVSTATLDIPAYISVLYSGTLGGTISEPRADLTLRRGRAQVFGREGDFTADTLKADLSGIQVTGLNISVPGLDLNLSGGFEFGSLLWNCSAFLRMDRLNMADYLESLPDTDISGTLTAGISGRGNTGLGGNMILDLEASSSSMASVSGLHLETSLSGEDVNLRGNVTAGGGSMNFDGTAVLGPGWVPQSWSMQADGEVSDFGFLDQFISSPVPRISSAWFSLTGNGSRFGMNLSGNAGVRNIDLDGISADRFALEGQMTYSSGRITRGMGFDGSVSVLGLSTEGISADTVTAQGTLGIRGQNMRAQGSFSMDSLRVAGQVLHADASMDLQDDGMSVQGLSLSASGGRKYTADLSLAMGDTLSLLMNNIRAEHSKLRLINGGDISLRLSNGRLLLDTLWLDPPVGELGVSGKYTADSIQFTADIDDLDLTSFSTFSGLPAEMSGVGSFQVQYLRDSAGTSGSIKGGITSPAYGQFSMDSITVDISASGDDFDVNGIYAWQDGVRSGLQMRATDVWSGTEISLLSDKIQWLELEVNNLGDWLFYALPLPIRTMGASVSARVEFDRSAPEHNFQVQASARIQRLFITILGVELPNVNFYLSYPDSSMRGYNSRFIVGSGSAETGNFSSTWRADIQSLFPFELGDYALSAALSRMEIAIPGIGAVIASGDLQMNGSGLYRRPLLSGKLKVLEGAVGIPQPVGTTSSAGGSSEMPFDLSVDVSGTGDIWFRTSFADIEMALKLRIFTLERLPTVNGTVSAVRGRITLLQRDFLITQGTVSIIQGNPPTMQLNVQAETTVRSAVSHEKYLITVLITGTAENPEITLTGVGPAGSVTQEDILTLLAAGLTYSEMQQLNSSAIRSEVESVAQSMLGSLLARNIRHEIGLDTFEISPELLSDSTSLVLNLGKYVLPDLYVSYKDDVFSGEPGTVSAQYLFTQDLYVEGSSRTTVHGNLEPTIELHYTLRY